MKRIPMKELVDFGVAFMTRRGVSRAKARYIAQVVVEAEAFRLSTHGIIQFNVINDGLGKSIRPDVEPKVIKNFGAMAVVNGEGCLSILSMKKARELAVAKAKKYGMGTVTVRNSGWIAALSTHILPLAEQGFMATAWAQSNSCQDCAPYGGIDPCFSTNPIAMAFPTAGDPVVADFSTATMSMGAANEMVARKKKSAVARFLDRKGRPTNDPAVIDHGGTLMFLGCEADGHKGYALSLYNEALTVMAGGSANNPKIPGRQTFGITVVDPRRFGTTAYYRREMKRFTARLRAVRPRPGKGRVRLPGERGMNALRDCRRRGIPMDAGKIQMLRDIAKASGLTCAW